MDYLKLKKNAVRWGVAGMALTVLAVGTIGTSVAAEQRELLRAEFDTAVKGKTIAWVPVWMGVLESEWTRIMKAHFDDYGMKFEVRDPNFKSDIQLQQVSSLIDQHPDVLVVQNPNATLLAREIKRAMDAGIYVVQVNMASNQLSDAYVGVDAKDLGRRTAREMVKDCGSGKGSGEISIIEGEATAAYSLDLGQGAMEVFKTDPSIKVVSKQPASWDANKAGDIMATVLQQHPNLCGVLGEWGPMSAGAAEAIKNAGKQGQVKLYVDSDGQPNDCDMVERGLFTANLSYPADMNGEAIADAVIGLLQSHDKPGTKHIAYYTALYWVKSKDDRAHCFIVPNEQK
jgi:ABC-type sugar transport system substrate-binding protein